VTTRQERSRVTRAGPKAAVTHRRSLYVSQPEGCPTPLFPRLSQEDAIHDVLGVDGMVNRARKLSGEEPAAAEPDAERECHAEQQGLDVTE